MTNPEIVPSYESTDDEFTDLEAFRQRISEIQQEEEEGKRGTVHLIKNGPFTGVDVKELTEEDMRAYNRFFYQYVDKQTINEFNKYRQSVEQTGNRSRKLFVQFLANSFHYPDGD